MTELRGVRGAFEGALCPARGRYIGRVTDENGECDVPAELAVPSPPQVRTRALVHTQLGKQAITTVTDDTARGEGAPARPDT